MDSSVPVSNVRSAQPIKLPVGISDFAKLTTEGYSFIDKSLLIEEVVRSGAAVTLITRPRRFGKMLNLSMLQYFFATQVRGKTTHSLFQGLAIARHPAVMAHQGKHPVIFFTFKDLRPKTLEELKNDFRGLLSGLCNGYPELLDSARLTERDRTLFKSFLDKQADDTDTKHALRHLSEMLAKHYERQVVILLDEYDTPVHNAFMLGFYDDLIDFMRVLFGAALKDNPCLFKGIITGILKVTKENLFSGLNNPEIATVLDTPYSRHFGFTEKEVTGLLEATGLMDRPPESSESIQGWYNGYRFGDETIYNPWSIINCISSKGKLDSYWTNTSGSDLLKEFMASADAQFKQNLERLMIGESIESTIDPNLVFGNLGSDSTTLWSLMLFSGYLTALAVKPATGREKDCILAIPNREIRYEYDYIIKSWFSGPNAAFYQDMLAGLVRGDTAAFEANLREYLVNCASFFDTGGRRPENFYHGIVLGMMVGLKDSHVIVSNREGGDGRFDLALFPRASVGKGASGGPGLILEFKRTSNAKKLKAAAKDALAQIDRRRYASELGKYRIGKVLSIGLAFAGKEVECVYGWRAVGGVARKRRMKRVAKSKKGVVRGKIGARGRGARGRRGR